MRLNAMMLKASVTAGAAALALFAGTPAHAILFESGPGLGIAIPDNGYTGALNPAQTASNTINVSGLNNDTITNVILTVGIDHQAVGDLTIKLLSPNGTVVRVMNRPGNAGNPDDGSDGGGSFANLSSTHRIIFDDSSANDAELMGNGLLTGDTVGVDKGSPDTYASDFDPFGLETADSGLATFNGEGPDGAWKIYIGDSTADVAGDGNLDYWSLTFDTITHAPGAVPEASTVGLVALAMAGVGVRLLGSRRRVATQRA